jgi:predicted RNA-binding Zn ribbon-like protein
MGWTAIDRYGLAHAPDGLALVQDLLNTVPAGRPRADDLLSDVESASAWAEQALHSWAVSAGQPVEPLTIAESDVDALRILRTDLRTVLDGTGETRNARAQTLRSVTVGAELRRDGTVAFAPRGEGWRRIASAVLIEIAAAQKVDVWRRLKICRNERCAVAFYDRSRNNSGVWHDVRVCGNAVNLRASRARRRTRALAEGT